MTALNPNHPVSKFVTENSHKLLAILVARAGGHVARQGTLHNALDDAVTQAEHANKVLCYLMGNHMVGEIRHG